VSTRGDTRLAADVECDGDAGGARTVVAGVRSATVASLRGAGASRALCRLTLRASGGEGEAAGVEIGAARVRQSAPAGPFAALGTPPTATPAVPAAGAPPPPASLVIYLVDTLRADRLGVYGYRQPVSPAIDRFARDAVVFEQARAQSSWTRPAVGTVLTGLDPVRHGATRSLSRLADAATTLGERLQAAGYWTGMATANPNVGQEFGFDQGFDDFVCVDCRGETGDDGEITAAVHRAALAGLDRAPSGRPFFLFVHTVEPHAPYRPTEPFRARFAADADPDLGERRTLSRLAHGSLELTPARERAVGELYDAEVALADAGFGAFLEQLARRGRLDDTAVLFLSDHGEELFEHGNVEHGRTLFEEQLRIPMIWRLPRGAHGGRRVAVPVDQLDIAPTVLALAGAPADPDLPGRDLSSVLEGGPTPEERPSLAWLDRRSFSLESVAFRRAKLVRDLTPDAVTVPFTETLFDLAADPGERRDLAGTRGLLRAFLASQLRAFRNRWGAALPTRDALTDPALRNRLRALGYLH
jgi:choline-sulfatase